MFFLGNLGRAWPLLRVKVRKNNNDVTIYSAAVAARLGALRILPVLASQHHVADTIYISIPQIRKQRHKEIK